LIQAEAVKTDRESRGLISKLLFPPFRVRFAIALLLSFFPYAILYPLDYPAGELVTLVAWIWVFPSRIGCLSLCLLPLVPNSTYGYFTFNLFCLGATVGTAVAASSCRKFCRQTVVYLYTFVRGSTFLVILICILQVFTNPSFWTSIFPNMSLGDGGRGAGLRSEPSLMAGPLTLYLFLLVARLYTLRTVSKTAVIRRSILREGVWIVLLILVLTRSISVLVITICFLPMLLAGRRSFLLPVLAAGSGLIVAVLVFGDRIREAIQNASGSIADLVTVAMGSWRNIPDLIIFLNFRDFLLPGDPADIRSKINDLAVSMSPIFAWLQNTYSTFAAGASTLGLLVTGVLFVGGMVAGLKLLSGSAKIRLSWVLLFVANWFLTPKYEATGWVVLGLLPLLHHFIESHPGDEVSSAVKSRHTRILQRNSALHTAPI